MIIINLLPKKYKTATAREKINFSVVAMFVLLLIIVGLAVELLFATNKFLDSYLVALQSRRQAYEQYFESQVNTEVYENVKRANALGIQIGKIQTNRTRWSNIIAEVGSLTPSDITLKTVKGDKLEKAVKIAGVADSRKKLLQYVQALDKSDYFTEADLPSSYLSDQTDITFEITVTLTEEALTNK